MRVHQVVESPPKRCSCCGRANMVRGREGDRVQRWEHGCGPGFGGHRNQSQRIGKVVRCGPSRSARHRVGASLPATPHYLSHGVVELCDEPRYDASTLTRDDAHRAESAPLVANGDQPRVTSHDLDHGTRAPIRHRDHTDDAYDTPASTPRHTRGHRRLSTSERSCSRAAATSQTCTTVHTWARQRVDVLAGRQLLPRNDRRHRHGDSSKPLASTSATTNGSPSAPSRCVTAGASPTISALSSAAKWGLALGVRRSQRPPTRSCHRLYGCTTPGALFGHAARTSSLHRPWVDQAAISSCYRQ